MINFTNEELKLINSNRPMENIDTNLVNSIINKMLVSKEYTKLINFLNLLHDFSNEDKIFRDLVDKLISENNKECISTFLDNEEELYFLNNSEKQKLITFLNVKKIYIKLKNTYDYYYKMLFSQGIRLWKTVHISDNIVEHSYTRYNKSVNFKIIENNNSGVLISYTNYLNYNLSKEEQILRGIDYLNEFGFDIERSIENIIDESQLYKE